LRAKDRKKEAIFLIIQQSWILFIFQRRDGEAQRILNFSMKNSLRLPVSVLKNLLA